MLEKVIENWTSRLDYIRASRGSHMPEIIFKILDDLFKEFERLDSTLSLEESELQEFEERYFYLNAKFNDKLDELNVRNQVSISNVEKFQYLKGLLTNEPASLIKHVPISNDSYEEAWQKLLDRHDNKKQIVQSLIKTFLDQKPISEANCFNLRKLLDTSDECLRGLNALGEQASSKDCWLIYLLLQKIDPESRRLWASKSSEEEFPNMKVFLDFLNGNETSQREGTSAETRNKASEFKGQAGESEIYSGASVNSELNLSFLPTAKDLVVFLIFFAVEKIVGSKNEPIAQRTMFGWVVAGKLNVKNKEPHELYSHFLSTAKRIKYRFASSEILGNGGIIR
ncbi:uncharacterized protein TNCV_4150201 [Trichonephila clavipes]|uniref:Peptidase aspartic putative domain-containing protein n=1 Tax=Trichonephila clavipes TaxID=2585209 RepID=A0A8X6W602_TRICX|nr:uncharacterized protein TNCV_4150201 [Trichonephila clavipes]